MSTSLYNKLSRVGESETCQKPGVFMRPRVFSRVSSKDLSPYTVDG